jgi:hypothetical protein
MRPTLWESNAGCGPLSTKPEECLEPLPETFEGWALCFREKRFAETREDLENLRNGHAMLPADFYQRFSARYRA